MLRTLPQAALPLLALTILLVGCDVNRGGIEPPPPEYAGRGLAPGAKLVQLGSRKEVDEACAREGIGPNEFQRLSGRMTLGCYSPKSHTVYMIERGKIPDYEWNELFEHEASAHSWGLVHPKNGRGWAMKPGNQPYAWGNVFAGAGMQTAATGNIFKGR